MEKDNIINEIEEKDLKQLQQIMYYVMEYLKC